MSTDKGCSFEELAAQARSADNDELPPFSADRLADLVASLQRIEKQLRDIRDTLDAAAREGKHRQYSPARLTGSILQVIVAGLIALAVLDWAFDAPADTLLAKLAFAAVLQLAALTAFIVARGKQAGP